ncbi:MAG: helix-turn-helix domain-containing protein [Chloroflexi bacterium]|nr:helix-turn-helix domain-containing protein [Chloroflexota bacterium]
MALHADAQGWSFPSIETISRETGLSRRAVYYALAALERTEVDGRQAVLRVSGGGRTSNRYLILARQDQVHAKAREAGLGTGAKNNAERYHFLHRTGAKSAPLTRTTEPEPLLACSAGAEKSAEDDEKFDRVETRPVPRAASPERLEEDEFAFDQKAFDAREVELERAAELLYSLDTFGKATCRDLVRQSGFNVDDVRALLRQ